MSLTKKKQVKYKRGGLSTKEGDVSMKEGFNYERGLLSTKEGFTPTFHHKPPPKKTPPSLEPHRPIFFYSTQTTTTTRKEGKEGRSNRYTGLSLFVYLKNYPIFDPIQIMLNKPF